MHTGTRMPYLELNGERHALLDGQTVVGSGAKATLRLPNVDLAGRHFIVNTGAGATTLESCSPHHVVVVNGHQHSNEAIPISEGDVIAAGSAVFVFTEDASRAVTPRYTPAPPSAYLVNQQARKAYALGRRSASIGRDTASHIHVAEPTISRFHADIRAEAGEYVLYSLGSAGTQVNGERVAVPRVLSEGDKIEFGDTALVFTRTAPTGMQISKGDDASTSPVSERPTIAHSRIDEKLEPIDRGGVPPVAIIIGVLVLIAVVWFVVF